MTIAPNQELRLRLSAYLGSILFLLIVGFTIVSILNDALLNMSYRSFNGNGGYGLYRVVLFLAFFLFMLIYILKIKKTIVIFGNDGTLSVESGFLGNGLKRYPLGNLTEVSPRQGVWNRITGDGKLILKFAMPDKRGSMVNKTLVLKGLSKWKELKSLSNELNMVLQQQNSGDLEQTAEEATA